MTPFVYPISMSDIDSEFGLGKNLGAYRGVTWYTDVPGETGTFSTTNLKMSSFLQKRVRPPGITDFAYLATAAGNISGMSTSIGVADPYRYIVVVCGIRTPAGYGSWTFTGATINGSAMNILAQSFAGNGVDKARVVGIFGAYVTSGTTGSFVFTTSRGNSFSTSDISTYRLVGDLMNVYNPITFGASNSLPPRSVAIAVSENEAGGNPTVWSGFSSTNGDTNKDKGNWIYSSASYYNSATTSTSRTLQGEGTKVGVVLYSPALTPI